MNTHMDLLGFSLGRRNEKKSSKGKRWQIELIKAIGNSYQVQIQQKRTPGEEGSSSKNLNGIQYTFKTWQKVPQ